MKKALVIGVDYYPHLSPLNGCVNDAISVARALERNYDGTLNFYVDEKLATNETNEVTRNSLLDDIKALFLSNSDIALLYFSGHGCTIENNGYIVLSDSQRGEDGIRMNDIIECANNSHALSKIIILDCCHAGSMAEMRFFNGVSVIGDGVTILTACKNNQYAVETGGRGVFTSLLIEALNGGASDIMGNITPSSIYAFIDRALGPWGQRPVFKTNVESFVSLRKAKPALEIQELTEITKIFNTPYEEYSLDPSYEPESDNPNPLNTRIFGILQKMESVNLVVPVGEEHMYHAAINSKSCKLTALGEHYWNLVKNHYI